jgi:Cu/Ag efflux pump CusA
MRRLMVDRLLGRAATQDIVVEYVNQLRSERHSLLDAVYSGARTRMRPVVMTDTRATAE